MRRLLIQILSGSNPFRRVVVVSLKLTAYFILFMVKRGPLPTRYFSICFGSAFGATNLSLIPDSVRGLSTRKFIMRYTGLNAFTLVGLALVHNRSGLGICG